MNVRRALVVVAVPIATMALLGAPAAATTATPVVGTVTVLGSGPGDVITATATGFTPGGAVTVTWDDAVASVPLAVVEADATGAVALPDGTRTPVTALPGAYHLVLTQDPIRVVSGTFTLVAPSAAMPDRLTPGFDADDPSSQAYSISVQGLADSPDVTRTVTVDGSTVVCRFWTEPLSLGASRAWVAFDVPANLRVGPHTVTFVQTGATPYTLSGTVAVDPPTIQLQRAQIAPNATMLYWIFPTATNDVLDLTVVGAAGDRHTSTYAVVGTGTPTAELHLLDMSPGTATITAVSRVNGATGSTTLTVLPQTVTSPQGLGPWDRLVDAYGSQQLLMQPDGDLAFSMSGYALWRTHTDRHPGAQLFLQPDGNAVIRDVDGHALWSTGTNGVGVRAQLGFDGSTTVLRAATGRVAWSNFYNSSPLLVGLAANQYVFKDEMLTRDLKLDAQGTVFMKMQSDGNVVVSTTHLGVRWSTETSGHPNAYLLLQNDGNLVVRAPNGTVLWSNGVHALGARIVPQNDGNVVEYAPNGKALWSTRTVIR